MSLVSLVLFSDIVMKHDCLLLGGPLLSRDSCPRGFPSPLSVVLATENYLANHRWLMGHDFEMHLQLLRAILNGVLFGWGRH